MEFLYNNKRVCLRGTNKFVTYWLDARKQIARIETIGGAELMMMMKIMYPNTGLHLMIMEETVLIKVKVEPRLHEVIDAHVEMFAVPNKLPSVRTQDHRIPFMPCTQPVNIKPYRHHPVQKDAIEAMVRELLDSGVIKHSQSSFASLVESKCVFGTTHVEYLGHMLFAEGVATDPTKIQAMQSWPIPTTIKQLRGFLGLAGYYRRFIRDFASISRPLTQLLKKNSFKWNNEAQQAFIFLKEATVQALVLALPKFNKPFVVETNASSIGLGEILQQEGNPIAYMSKSLAPKQQALSTYENESLQHEVFVGSEDYHTMKWLPKLIGFDYEVEYKKGIDNAAADALSRREDISELFTMSTTFITTDLYKRIKASDGEILSTLHSKPKFSIIPAAKKRNAAELNLSEQI
ncbi:putative mitochondrial protein [Tanacetum coccineum]|uniref:Mitochondrial protein n=1 Tax=Tanacetum coccineum TaxID=301880 RepID=A0ABQ4Z2T6_9ASTR